MNNTFGIVQIILIDCTDEDFLFSQMSPGFKRRGG